MRTQVQIHSTHVGSQAWQHTPKTPALWCINGVPGVSLTEPASQNSKVHFQCEILPKNKVEEDKLS